MFEIVSAARIKLVEITQLILGAALEATRSRRIRRIHRSFDPLARADEQR